jgi:S-(hydroxymethyl)mycothiol dehydrogenase
MSICELPPFCVGLCSRWRRARWLVFLPAGEVARPGLDSGRAFVAQQVRGVVARAQGEPVGIEQIVIPDPGPGDVVVAVKACGVCHTDLHYREGAINDDFPFLLGHEAAGHVESVGAGVTNVAPGDYVVLAWRAPCGTCRSCLRGRPWYCFASSNASEPMTLTDGTPLSPALGIGAFAEKTLVAAGQAVKVDPAARPEAAGLIGCGVMAGFGAAVNTGGVSRGDTVAVFGCGGVGDAAIAGAALAGARKIIAVDLDDRKLEWAKAFGATDLVNAGKLDAVEAIKDLTGGFGADVVIEAVGRPDTYKQAFFARDLAGVLVQVGVPDPAMTIELPLIELFGRGGALKSSWYGDCLPTRDFPMLIDLYLKGRLDLDRFVTETVGLGDVEEAFARMQRGEVLRSVVVL